jgi:hypothetical protein
MKYLKYLVLFSAFILYACNNDTGSTIVNNSGGTNNHAPVAPNTPTPPDSAENFSNIIYLSWHCSDPDAGDTLTYDIYFSNANPPQTLLVSNYPMQTYEYGVVEHNLQLYWKVIAKDQHGAITSGPVWKFKTAP